MTWSNLHFLHDVSSVITLAAIAVGSAFVLVAVVYGAVLVAGAALARRRRNRYAEAAQYVAVLDAECDPA
jgi:hypothetical protein